MAKDFDEGEHHSGLWQLRGRLQHIHDSISNFQPLTTKPPILDSSFDAGDQPEEGQWLQQEHIPGLKKLRDSVKIDLDVLEKFLNDPNSAHLPPLSTNAPYLIAVWHEVLCGPFPIDSVFKSMSLSPADSSIEPRQRGGQRPPAAKVDVVAHHGRRWIRVNTIKNARLLAEFREIDSYLTDSDDDVYEELEDARPTLAQTEFDNSILKMGRSLLAAAKSNPVEGTTEIPRITLRLTRLDPSPIGENGEENDPRIAQTVQCLKDMGIDVELGERREEELPENNLRIPSLAPSAPPVPTFHINLDLSVLIALISDLTHSPLPKTIEEASTRFIPPQEYREWKKKKNGFLAKRKPKVKSTTSITDEAIDGDGTDGNDIPKDMVKHSRALTNQLLQEMGKGLLQEIHDRISAITSGASRVNVSFWTTPEARERCLRIISKIGGPSEKRRAHAIFSTVSNISDLVLSPSQAEDAFWQGSRYPPKFVALFPINIYPPSPTPDTSLVSEACSLPLPQFFRSLGKTCQDILAQETMPHPRSFPEDLAIPGSSEYTGEIQRAIVTKANPRLTAHTVQSLLWGAELGWTTLTANKTSIKAILREIKIARVSGRLEEETQHVGGAVEDNRAAIWVVDPRSLAEGMSSHTTP